MPERISPDLRPLVKLAKEQNWTVAGTDNSRLVWRGPNGEGPVYTDYRAPGRQLQKIRGELVRAGLKMDEKTALEHATSQQALEMIDAGGTLNRDEIEQAIKTVWNGLGSLFARAELFDQAKKEQEEWERLSEEVSAEVERLKAENQSLQSMLGAITDCFRLAPWAILPEIAKLLGVDASAPLGQPSAAQAATSTRRTS